MNRVDRRSGNPSPNVGAFARRPKTDMQDAIVALECRSQAQAMDWSLVLISQGVESIVTRRPDDGAWMLEVAAPDLERAAESLRAYERENVTGWRRELKWTGLLFDSRAVWWFAALILFYAYAFTSPMDFRAAGAVDGAAIWRGEWWRFFTAVTLHADAAHLAANVTIGIVFLGLAMGCFGAGNAVLLSFVGGALGNVATWLLHEGPYRSLGASGMVMAALGLLTAHSLSFARHEKRAVWFGRSLGAGCLLLVLLGFSPASDIIAHVAGFLAGILLGSIALRSRKFLLRRMINVAALSFTASLVLATWWLALRR